MQELLVHIKKSKFPFNKNTCQRASIIQQMNGMER